MNDRDTASRFDVFVSYNSSDHAAVERIARELVERGLAVFIDRWDLVPGQSWPEVLERRINDCCSAAIVVGPSGIGTWQHREQFLALDRQARDSRFSVIPVLLPGADPALGFLALNTWIDLRAGIGDPHALDLLAAAAQGASPTELLEESRRTSADVCPYRGLEAFREEDAPFFFGRAAFTKRLLEQVITHEFVAVVGASGSGKSSVVRAGLVPTLRRGTNGTMWDILTLAPGAEPLAALVRTLDPPPSGWLVDARAHVNAAAARLRADDVTVKQLIADHLAQQPGTDRLLLIVDQFEELATLAEDNHDASRFVDLLLDASGPGGVLTVLITLRSDFYTQIVQRRDLNDRLQGAVVHVGPLSRFAPEGDLSELETIIRRPAEAVGLGFEDGLVARMVADVGDEPGNLPLLEYLLTELWRQRGRGLLTHEAYDALGGVQGAIARRADEAYAQLAPGQQLATRRLFLSLIRPGEGQQDTRVPAPFPDNEQEAEVARRFAGPGVRLLVADEDTLRGRVVQMSHEALIRSWSRLRRWVDQNRDTLRARERVRERMHHWREQNGPDDLLLPPGLELEEGRRLLDSETDVATDEVRGYIHASIAAEESRRRRRHLWASITAAAGLLLLAVTGWQWQEAKDARDQAQQDARRAKQERDLAIAQQLTAIAAKIWEENPGENALAAMLAVESQAKRNTPEANALLRDVLALTPLDMPFVDNPWVNAGIQLSADGRVQAFENRDFWGIGSDETSAWSSVKLLDSADLSPVSTRRFGGDMRPLISPDGRWMVSAGYGRRLVITDLDSREEVVDEPTRSASFPVFAADGATLYIAQQTGVIEVRKPPTYEVTRQLTFPVAGARHVGLQVGTSADGGRLLVIDRERGAYVVPTDGEAVSRLDIEVNDLQPRLARNYLRSGSVSPVGQLGLTRQARGRTRLWNLETARERLTFDDEARASASAFSPNGQMIATANSMGGIFLRAVDDGARLHEWQHRADWDPDDDGINVLAFSADGELLASAGEDGAIVVWSVADGALRHRLEFDAPVVALAILPWDDDLLAGTEDGTLARIDLGSGAILAIQRFDGIVASIATGGQGRSIAVGIRETWRRASWNDIRFVERASGRELSHFSFNGELRSQRLSPDASRFAALDPARGQVLVWDTASAEVLLAIPSRAGPVTFSPDSQRLLLHGGSGPVGVVDTLTGDRLTELGEPGGISEVFGVAYRDTAITLGSDRSLRGWDLSTGESRWHTVPERKDARVTTSPGGESFAYYAEADGAMHVFESSTGRRMGSVRVAKPTGGFSLSDDGSRLLTTHRVKNPESSRIEAYDIEVWDVPTATSVRRKRLDARHLAVQSIGGAQIALLGTSVEDEQSTSWLEMIDWDSGRVTWSLSARHGAPFLVKHVNRGRDRILIEGPSSPEKPPARQLRSLSTGSLIWQEPGSSLRAAADIPGSDLIALADATSLDTTKDVIRLLSSETGEERRRISAGGFARHVAATADGSRVMAAIEGERWRGVRVWSVDDGRLLREIELDANPKAILPLSDPDHFAVEDFADNLRTFDLRTGTQLHRISHTRSADQVAAARDTDRAVTVAGASLRVWDTRDGREIARRITHGDASSVVVSPDGKRVAYLTRRPRTTETGDEFQAAVIWAPERDAMPNILPVEDVKTLQFDPSGRYLALLHSRQGEGKLVRVIDAGTLRTELTVSALRIGSINDVSWRADGNLLLVRETGRYKGTRSIDRHSLRAFDVKTGKEVIRVDMGFRLLPAPGTSEVLFQDVDQRWRSVDLSRVGLDRVLAKANPERLVAPPHSPLVLATSYWKRTLVHDMTMGQTLILTTGEGPFNVLHAELDAGGRFIALSLRGREWREDSPGLIMVVDATDGAELARLKTERAMWNVAFVDGGNALIMSELRGHLPKDPDRLLVHWNWRTGAQKTLVKNNPVRNFAVSSDGRRFATAEGSWHTDREIDEAVGTLQLRVWDGVVGAELIRVPLDFYPSGVALSPDGSHVAVGGRNNVLLFDAENGSEVARFGRHAAGRITERDFVIETDARLVSGQKSLGFAGEGRVLVIAETNGVLLFGASKDSTRRLTGPEPLKQFAISADGNFLAMQGERFVSVWDVTSGEALIRTEMSGIDNLTFGGESGQELLAVRGGRIFQLRWRPEDLSSLACKAFKNGDWQRGRVRVIQESGRHPCDL